MAEKLSLDDAFNDFIKGESELALKYQGFSFDANMGIIINLDAFGRLPREIRDNFLYKAFEAGYKGLGPETLDVKTLFQIGPIALSYYSGLLYGGHERKIEEIIASEEFS